MCAFCPLRFALLLSIYLTRAAQNKRHACCLLLHHFINKEEEQEQEQPCHVYHVPVCLLSCSMPITFIVLVFPARIQQHNTKPRGERFHHVRVPRTSLLGGVAEVSPEGRYSRVPGGQKQSYGAMLAVRANIVINASRSMARALTSESLFVLR